MLMYTSCAWFFSDISGIETVQNLRYAARAVDLAAPFAPLDLEAVLLEDLGRARSNLEIHRNGRQLWERQVRPSRVTAEHAVARLLADGLLGHAVRPQGLYRWSLAPDPVVQEGEFVLAAVGATSEVTGETLQFGGACRRDGAYGFLAGIAPLPSPEAWTAFVAEARVALAPDGRHLVAWSGRHAARLLRLHDLLPDERHAVLRQFLAEADAALVKDSARLCDEALPVAEAMAAAGMPLPAWLKTLLERHWSARFADALVGLGGVMDPAAYAGPLDLSDRARLLGIGLDFSSASIAFGHTLVACLEAIADASEADRWLEFLDLLQLASRLGLGLPERALQDRMFALLRTRLPDWVGELRDIRDARYGAVVAMLAVATRLNLRTEEFRERLAPLEEPVATDPTYWP
jgi:hypothetical protein